MLAGGLQTLRALIIPMMNYKSFAAQQTHNALLKVFCSKVLATSIWCWGKYLVCNLAYFKKRSIPVVLAHYPKKYINVFKLGNIWVSHKHTYKKAFQNTYSSTNCFYAYDVMCISQNTKQDLNNRCDWLAMSCKFPVAAKIINCHWKRISALENSQRRCDMYVIWS